MSSQDVISRIKELGYWRILCHPLTYNREFFPNLPTTRKALEDAQVRLRGWYYPHIQYTNNGHGGTSCGQDYVESFCVSSHYNEIARLYQSGQFVHLLALREDFRHENGWPTEEPLPSDSPKFIDFIGILYTLTELIEFIRRLSNTNVYASGLELSIQLHKTGGRRLISYDRDRELYGEYVCSSPSISYQNSISSDDIPYLESDFAVEIAKYFYERFTWLNPLTSVLKDAQLRLLERRF